MRKKSVDLFMQRILPNCLYSSRLNIPTQYASLN